jgi:hypothetical protein
MAQWAQAINAKGGFGEWREDVADFEEEGIHDILNRHGGTE